MPTYSSDEVGQPLDQARDGLAESVEEMIALVYDSLRDQAALLMRDERASHTLQPTAVVHEALIKLIRNQSRIKDPSPREFVEIARAHMRHVLVEHARARRTAKRGGRARRSPLDEAAGAAALDDDFDASAVAEALERFTARFPRAGQVVSLRFFLGLTVPEVAERLGVSRSTVEADFRLARAWLRRDLEEEDQDVPSP